MDEFLSNYEAAVRQSKQPVESVADNLSLAAHGLATANGELARTVRRFTLEHKDIDVTRVRRELAAALFYVTRAAHALGLTLGDVAATGDLEMKKYAARGINP